MGESVTEADVRLFTTLVRFDVVYHGHFKCNRQKLTELPALWGYARDLFQTAGFGDTVDFDQIKRHYYVVHSGINPTGDRAARPRPGRLDLPAARPRPRRPQKMPSLGSWDTTTGTPPAGPRTAPGCGWCWRSPRACSCSRWSAGRSPAPWPCSPTPATWPPTRPRWCSPSGRRTSRR